MLLYGQGGRVAYMSKETVIVCIFYGILVRAEMIAVPYVYSSLSLVLYQWNLHYLDVNSKIEVLCH